MSEMGDREQGVTKPPTPWNQHHILQERSDRAVEVLNAAWMARSSWTDDRIFEARAILKGEA